MGSVHEGLKTFNAFVRTIVLAVITTVLGWGGYVGYSEYTKREREMAEAAAQIETLSNELKVKSEEVDKLSTSIRLLTTDQRLARLEVLGIDRDEEGKAIKSRLQFIELSPGGDPISLPKKFELPGDVIYVDNWIIKFDDKFIEQEDLERGTSLCLFRRIFSEDQKPGEGFTLDTVGMRPQAYAHGGQLTDFEKHLWAEFWEFANDPQKAADMGIRAANGEAVSVKVREGKSYLIELRASGGLSLKPVNQSVVQ